MEKSAKIFISHSSKDKSFVRRLAEDLRNLGVPVWFDEWELKVGDSLNFKIEEGIKDSSWLAVVISSNSINSKWVQKELNAAFSKELQRNNVFILPILMEDCEVPLFLKDKVFADFRKSYEKGFEALIKSLIPVNPYYPKSISKETVDKKEPVIHKQPTIPNPNEFLIKIENARIEGKDSRYSGLYNIYFKLNRTPDDEWIELFQHPTTFSLSVHPARVEYDEIFWQGSEEDISRNKHWIYDWVEDANQRFLPFIQKKIQSKQDSIRKSHLENQKVADLENLLRGGREGTFIHPTNAVMVGVCSLRLEGCSAPNVPAPITQVNFQNEGHIHLCFNCLKKQIDEGKYRVE